MSTRPDPAAPTSAELIGRMKSRAPGWREAFGELVKRNQGWVRGYLRARIRDWAAADDLAQDVFVTAYRKIDALDEEASFEGWLRGIALNHLRNFVRKRREQYVGGHEELQEIAEQACERWQPGADAGDRSDALRECLEKLDGPSRELLDQRYTRGSTVREMAERTGKGYSALTMQLHRVREILARCIEHKTGWSPS